MILLNPGPANTTDHVKQAMTKPDICPREEEFGWLMASVAARLTRVVHQEDRFLSVLFGGSGTAAVEATISSVVPTDGQILIIDNGSYGTRMAQIASTYSIPYDVIDFGIGSPLELMAIEERLANKDGAFSHLAVVHHETSTGMLNPVSEVGELCQKYGLSMIVDAMSSYAGLPIDIEEIGADYLVSSSNKCIQGMAGLSFVIGRRSSLDELASIPPRSLYLNLPAQQRFFEQYGQMRFTPPVQVFYALDQALEEYFAEGQNGRFRRYRENWEALDGGMLTLGFKRLLPEPQLSKILTAYLEPDHPHYNFERFHNILYSKGFTIYPGKGARKATFRIANMGAVTAREMSSFIDALKETIEEMGLCPLYLGSKQENDVQQEQRLHRRK